MTRRRIVIAGTESGAGKTTLTIGLMAVFIKKGYVVQGFKCGPDYIDPTYHTAVTGRISRNLDSWMLEGNTVKEIFNKGSEGADLSIIEGVMGLYDGKEATSNRGSTAEISMLTESPVVLVVDCYSKARSAAAVVKGFQAFCEDVRIVGVIANRIGSDGHYRLVKEAIELECGIPLLGYLMRESHIELPERHLGLIPSLERGELKPMFDQLADLISKSIDLERLLELSSSSPLQAQPKIFVSGGKKQVRIAVAKDSAFHFYYPENIELLEANGAECVFFSPLNGEEVPADVDGLYIGGGFPEEFADQLSRDAKVKESIRRAIGKGLPTLAECGGFMYLTEAVETTDGARYPMVGVIPGKIKMQSKLAALGYREITGCDGNFILGPHDQARGHEFHYSIYIPEDKVHHAYLSKGLFGVKDEGYMKGNLVAGYTHFHFASQPAMAKAWVDQCLKIRVMNSNCETPASQ